VKRFPLVSTLIVVLAIGTMIRLGFWQLDRRAEKEALIATFVRNTADREMSILPRVGQQFLFRRAQFDCPYAGGAEVIGAGQAGYRVITFCRGIGKIQLGTTRNPKQAVQWPGGTVSGWIQSEPDSRSMIEAATDKQEPFLMLVADPPLAGLAPNPPAAPQDVPNNHLAYAVQWFLFAAIAAVIFLLATRRRRQAAT
jgi:surfeit locus 1 family protein